MQRNPRNKRSFAGFVAAQNLANQHIWSHVQHAQPRSVGQTIVNIQIPQKHHSSIYLKFQFVRRKRRMSD
ncbi:hypothetical protein L596_025670 [Steinernema carpocapsae]|uniref:Uncharacterized protein n=1 Tax=Steinernema carpocapsae TaxID=34508 RepID=A0A4U5M8F4_STECR|nr:hypothetical protein L596_025670 [Steinernema carpocapsae]